MVLSPVALRSFQAQSAASRTNQQATVVGDRFSPAVGEPAFQFPVSGPSAVSTKDRVAHLQPIQQMYVNGKFVDAHSGKTFDVIHPATREVIARVPDADEQDVDAAVAAARTSFDKGVWCKDKSPAERGRILFKVAELIRRDAKDLAELEALNMGKPLREAEADIADAATCFEYYAGMPSKITGEVLPVPDNALNMAVKVPVGVAGQIIPWNYPILMAAWKLAPALAAGCSTVLKPAESTPLTALKLARLIEEAGVPAGVVNVVTGFGKTGGAMVNHPDVDKIAFTGSLETGKRIMKAAADTMKRVTLELGGKSPDIVFADADVDKAVEGALFGIMVNQGEVCSAGSRILVQESIYPQFLEKIKAKAKNITLGDPLNPRTTMGPLINQAQYDRVLNYIEVGKTEGKVLIGGGPAHGPGLENGFFVQPTLFYDVDNKARVAQEEIFGPVGVIIPFKDEADAVRMANDTKYGLAGAVWTQDHNKAMRVVNNVRAGVMWVNVMQPTYIESPWGGFKQSGFGRELGRWGLEEYLETKQIHIDHNDNPLGVGWYSTAAQA